MFRAFVLAVSVGGLAVAAPVPKAPPAPSPKTPATLLLGTAVVDGPRLRISYDAPPLASAAVRGPGPGRATTRTALVTLEAVKVTTADGTELTGDDLTKRLAESPAVARSTTALDPEWKKLFAADVLFIEPNGKNAGVNPANPIAPVAPGAIRPLPIRRGVVVEPPVEEKKEEPKKEEPKKEEKKEEKK